MSHSHQLSGCVCCPMSRRGFLAGCATCTGASVIPMRREDRGGGRAQETGSRDLRGAPRRCQPGPGWPNVGFDFRPVMERMTAALSAGCPEIELIPATATGEEQAKAILAKDAEAKIDGYVVVQLNCWNRVVQTMAASGKPVLYADFPYAGRRRVPGLHGRIPPAEDAEPGFIGSSKFDDVVKERPKCFLSIEKPDQFAAAEAKVRAARTRPKPAARSAGRTTWRLRRLQVEGEDEPVKVLTVGGEGWRTIKPVIEEATRRAGDGDSLRRGERRLEGGRQGRWSPPGGRPGSGRSGPGRS